MNYAEQFYTDPSITDEVLTNEVMEEIGKYKAQIIADVLPYWEKLTGDRDVDVLAMELEPCTPDFIRALAQALAADPLTRAAASLQMVLDPNEKPRADDDGEFDALFTDEEDEQDEQDDEDEEDKKPKE